MSYSPREWLATGTAQLCRCLHIWQHLPRDRPQLLSRVQLQQNIPGQRSFGGAQPQSTRDEGAQHPGPLATAPWSLSNCTLVP